MTTRDTDTIFSAKNRNTTSEPNQSDLLINAATQTGTIEEEVSEETLAERVLRLRKEIEYHTHRYYVLDDPEISDAALDSLMRKLRDLEQAHPSLQDPS